MQSVQAMAKASLHEETRMYSCGRHFQTRVYEISAVFERLYNLPPFLRKLYGLLRGFYLVFSVKVVRNIVPYFLTQILRNCSLFDHVIH